MKITVERRALVSRVEFRERDGAPKFVGRAVEYDQWSEPIYGMFVERIAPGAFDESLRSASIDVYASVDHDPCKVLGRVSASTLRLNPDDRGIAVEVPMAEYSYAQDLRLAIRRGDIRGMSFIFDVLDDKWERKDGMSARTVTRADLYEVAFVFFPAYSGTEAGLRSAPLALAADAEKRAIDRMYEALTAPTLTAARWRLELAERET